MENNKPTRPFCLEYGEAESEICNAINKAINVNKIPCFLLEGILTNLLHQTKEQAKIERANAAKSYGEQMAEYNKGEGEA